MKLSTVHTYTWLKHYFSRLFCFSSSSVAIHPVYYAIQLPSEKPVNAIVGFHSVMNKYYIIFIPKYEIYFHLKLYDTSFRYFVYWIFFKFYLNKLYLNHWYAWNNFSYRPHHWDMSTQYYYPIPALSITKIILSISLLTFLSLVNVDHITYVLRRRRLENRPKDFPDCRPSSRREIRDFKQEKGRTTSILFNKCR